MAEVKWIKMMVGMFDGMSFKKIKRSKIGGESFRDKLTAVWFELMDLAGKCNHNGALVNSSGIPFTDLEEIAIQIDRDEEELKLCMGFYTREGMVTIDSNNMYSLSNWGEYQSTDKLNDLREYNRLAKQKSRAKQKLLQAPSGDVNDKSMTGHPCQDTEEEGDKEKDIDKDVEIERMNEKPFDQSSEKAFKNDFSTDLYTSEDKIRRPLDGELGKGVVLLSPEQMNDLLDKLSLEEFDHYVGVVADCILSGKHYKRKTHYQAILDMAMADRMVK